MIKVGIIGLGKMGISHYSICNAHPQAKVVAVCDTSKFLLSAVSQYGQVDIYQDYKKMLCTCPIDSVIISTPSSSHYEIVRHSLMQNQHVFVEKPFCLTSSQGKELAGLAKEKKRVNQVGYHYRFVGAFQKSLELLRLNAIGDVYHVTAEAYGPVVLRPKGITWRVQRSEGGGCLHDYTSHVVDLVHYLVGHPQSVSGCVCKSIYSKSVEDAVYATMTFSNDVTGQLSVNWSDESFRKMSTQITVYGTKGKIIADRQECKVYLREKTHPNLDKGWNVFYTTDLTKPVNFYLRGEEYSHQLDYFIQKCLQDNLDNINSFDSAIQTDTILEWIMDNAKQRR